MPVRPSFSSRVRSVSEPPLLDPPFARSVSPNRRRRRTGRWTFAVVVVVVAISVGIIFPRLGPFLDVSDDAIPSEVTLLTYGVSIRRGALDAGVTRLQSGATNRLLLGALNSRDADFYVTPNSAELARDYLVRAGVTARLIETLPSVASEWEEGERLRDVVMRDGVTTVVVFAPDFRSRRTRGVLRRVLGGTGATVRVVSFPDVEVRLHRWWETRPGINVIYNEYPRLAWYWFQGRLG